MMRAKRKFSMPLILLTVTLVLGVSACGQRASVSGPRVTRAELRNPTAVPNPTSPAQTSPVHHPPDSHLFTQPNAPAYVAGKGFNPDVERVLDITALRLSLDRYFKAKGRYPQNLDQLFPKYAPKAYGRPMPRPPSDPATHQPYEYLVFRDGAEYALIGSFSSGKSYTVTGTNGG